MQGTISDPSVDTDVSWFVTLRMCLTLSFQLIWSSLRLPSERLYPVPLQALRFVASRPLNQAFLPPSSAPSQPKLMAVCYKPAALALCQRLFQMLQQVKISAIVSGRTFLLSRGFVVLQRWLASIFEINILWRKYLTVFETQFFSLCLP